MSLYKDNIGYLKSIRDKAIPLVEELAHVKMLVCGDQRSMSNIL